MDEIRFFVKLKEEPIDKDKKEIEKLFESIILAIDSNAKIHVSTRSGSWVIVVWTALEAGSTWLISELGSWLASKSFDWGQKRISQLKNLPSATDQEKVLNLPPENAFTLQQQSIHRSNTLEINPEDIQNILTGMAQVLKHPVFDESERTNFKVGKWSSKNDLGLSFSLTKTRGEVNETEYDFSIAWSDTKKDFDTDHE